jgi:hypothetical protein
MIHPPGLTTDRRLFWLKAVLAGGLLAGLLLTPRLWLSARDYPLSPILESLPTIPDPLDYLLYGFLLLLLVAIVITTHSRRLIVIFLCLAGILALADQSRWQPWFYLYLCMLAAFVFCAAEQTLHACRFILAATYFWSGVQKCNASFLTEVFPWLLEPFLSESARRSVMPIGVVIPLLEAAMGLGLLAVRVRRIAVVLVLVMHAGLLVCLGPFGQDWNTVVWPWNLAMMAMVVLLFWGTADVSIEAIVCPGRSPYRWVVLFLFGVMPAFNFADRWDSYLSAGLYSGNLIDADLEISRTVHERLPEAAKPSCSPIGDGYVMDLTDWSMRELNAPPYPARRVYRQIARRFCRLTDPSTDVVLVIHERPDWWTGKRNDTREDGSALCGRRSR